MHLQTVTGKWWSVTGLALFNNQEHNSLPRNVFEMFFFSLSQRHSSRKPLAKPLWVCACVCSCVLRWERAGKGEKEKEKRKYLGLLHSPLYSNRAFPSCNRAFFQLLSSCSSRHADTESTRSHKPTRRHSQEPALLGTRSDEHTHPHMLMYARLCTNTPVCTVIGTNRAFGHSHASLATASTNHHMALHGPTQH